MESQLDRRILFEDIAHELRERLEVRDYEAGEAIAASREMRRITVGENPAFTLPILDFAAAPAGIDARKVADSGVLPIVNTGIAHREAGVGQIGAGITAAPMDCFVQAVRALYRELAAAGEVPAA